SDVCSSDLYALHLACEIASFWSYKPQSGSNLFYGVLPTQTPIPAHPEISQTGQEKYPHGLRYCNFQHTHIDNGCPEAIQHQLPLLWQDYWQSHVPTEPQSPRPLLHPAFRFSTNPLLSLTIPEHIGRKEYHY